MRRRVTGRGHGTVPGPAASHATARWPGLRVTDTEAASHGGPGLASVRVTGRTQAGPPEHAAANTTVTVTGAPAAGRGRGTGSVLGCQRP